MGLETVHGAALERLNKKMTVEEFAVAAGRLQSLGVALRVFLLVSPPFVPPAEQDHWLLRSIDAACDAGASAIALIPTRPGNGALDAVAAEGCFQPPTLADLERSLDLALAGAAGKSARVFADLWDLERLAGCTHCFDARRERLRRYKSRSKTATGGQVLALRAAADLMTTLDVDVAIVGSGFSGALCALALRQRGRSVALLERGRHPRFAIGESTTPLTNLLIEEFADRYDLPQVRSFSKWGTWQRDHAECRLWPQARIHVSLSSPRRGFHRRRDLMPGNCWSPPVRTITSPIPIGTGPTSIWRSSSMRRKPGAIYLDTTRLDAVSETATGMRLSGSRGGETVDVTPALSSMPAARADF